MKKLTSVFTAILLLVLMLTSCNTKSPTKSESDTVTDVDGNVYQTVVIGNQRWMAEDLKVTHYSDGSSIAKITSNTAWQNLTSGAYCAHENDENNVATFGYLYNWFAVNDNHNIAPQGWRVPTDADWKELEMYLGMSQEEADKVDYRGTDEGGKLKEAGTSLWSNPNIGATNESGFTGRPGSYRYEDGNFHPMSPLGFALYWTSTETGATNAWDRLLSSDEAKVYRHNRNKACGMAVRLVKDN